MSGLHKEYDTVKAVLASDTLTVAGVLPKLLVVHEDLHMKEKTAGIGSTCQQGCEGAMRCEAAVMGTCTQEVCMWGTYACMEQTVGNAVGSCIDLSCLGLLLPDWDWQELQQFACGTSVVAQQLAVYVLLMVMCMVELLVYC